MPLAQFGRRRDVAQPLVDLRLLAARIQPQLVAEIGFTEWTEDGKLRHPRFMGLRTDKPAQKVVRERPGEKVRKGS